MRGELHEQMKMGYSIYSRDSGLGRRVMDTGGLWVVQPDISDRAPPIGDDP
jgi:hypothetical protein